MAHLAVRSFAHHTRYATINRDLRNEDPALDLGISEISPLKNKNNNNLDLRRTYHTSYAQKKEDKTTFAKHSINMDAIRYKSM